MGKIGETKLEEKAANTLLEKGTSFKINGLGKFTMRPLYLGTMVEISKDALKVNTSKDVTPLNVIASAKNNAKPAVRIIAKAILNSRLKIALFSGILSRLLYWKLTPSELDKLVLLMVKNSEADFFFSSTTLLSGMRVMDHMQETTASGEQLPG